MATEQGDVKQVDPTKSNLVAFANNAKFVGYANIPPNSISNREVAVQFKSQDASTLVQPTRLGTQPIQAASNILQISVVTNGQASTERFTLNQPLEICLVATINAGVLFLLAMTNFIY